MNTLLLLQSSRSSSDSSFQSFEKMTLDSWLSLNNPIIFSFVILIVILAVVYVYYRYAIIPLKKRHLIDKENVRLQEAKLAAMLAKYSPDPIFRFDENGEINLSNDAAHEAFKGNDFHLKTVKQLFPELANMDIEDFITNNSHLKFISDLDDKIYQWIIHGISRHGIAQMYGREITELIQKDEELRQALDEARRANDLKDDFLSRISHEIRSPLASVQGNARTVYEESKDLLDEEYRELLLLVENSGKRLVRSVDLLINVSLIHTKNYRFNKTKINLYDALYNIYRKFQSISEETRIEFTISDKGTKNYIVTADEYSIEKIFENLLDNAFTYTEEGKISIELKEDNGYIYTMVTDTGEGISEEYQRLLFTPFSQEQMGYSRQYDGLGLGLFLVKRLAELNGAEVGCRSEENKGTTIELIFKNEAE